MSITAMKQALEALASLTAVARRYLPDYDEHPEIQKADAAITSLRQAIEQAEKQEPVAVWELFEDGWDSIADPEWMESLPVGTKLYTTPQPQREWVGLTPADFDNLEQLFGNKVSNDFVFADIVCVISAKLKEKNT